MCLLVYMNPKSTVERSALDVAAVNNPDGFGWAIQTREEIFVGHSMKYEEAADSFYEKRAEHPEGRALFHLRIATHGTVTIDNCHPFWVGPDKQTIMAHNGILPIASSNGRCDSKVFAEDWLHQLGLPEMLDDDAAFADLENFCRGSKLVILSNDERLKYWSYIVNEGDGDWLKDKEGNETGVWMSNDSWTYVWQWSGQSYHGWGWNDADGWDGPAAKEALERWSVGAHTGTIKLTADDQPRPNNGRWYTNGEVSDLYAAGYDLRECVNCLIEFVVDYGAVLKECPDCTACFRCGEYLCFTNDCDEMTWTQRRDRKRETVELYLKREAENQSDGDDGADDDEISYDDWHTNFLSQLDGGVVPLDDMDEFDPSTEPTDQQLFEVEQYDSNGKRYTFKGNTLIATCEITDPAEEMETAS